MKRNNITLKIITCLVCFFIISLISVYSAWNLSKDNLENILVKQIIYYMVGVVLLLIAFYKKKEIIKYSSLWYLGFNFLLLLLLILGISINGSRCWLIIGPFSFQPSEFMKISLIITLSKLLYKYDKKNSLKEEFKLLLCILVILIIPSILTFLEPDTGVVIIYFVITISMLLYRGINKKWYYIFFMILIIICGIITYLYIFKNEWLLNILGDNIFYRMDRVLDWSNGSGYQLDNSITSIATGGLLGFGINNTPLYFPEASTDFIFATFSSNFGLIGSIILFLIIIIFDSNILFLIDKKTFKTDKFLLIGIFTMILYQQVQNISMTIGLLPITGITLPFISYGGSSLLSYMFVTGIILNISNNKEKFLN